MTLNFCLNASPRRTQRTQSFLMTENQSASAFSADSAVRSLDSGDDSDAP
jgi:hypothetical protein